MGFVAVLIRSSISDNWAYVVNIVVEGCLASMVRGCGVKVDNISLFEMMGSVLVTVCAIVELGVALRI